MKLLRLKAINNFIHDQKEQGDEVEKPESDSNQARMREEFWAH